jgi:hypothetical protein
MITSKFRIDFWIGKVFKFMGVVAMMVFVFYLSARTGTVDYHSVLFWIGVLLFIWTSMNLYRFLFDELKVVTVSEAGISIKYLLAESDRIQFQEIRDLELYPVRTVRGKASGVSHYELVITLHDGEVFTFDGYQFKNFGAVKSMIYQYVYHE